MIVILQIIWLALGVAKLFPTSFDRWDHPLSTYAKFSEKN